MRGFPDLVSRNNMKRRGAAVTVIMKGARNRFLSAAGLAYHQDGAIDIAEPSDHLVDLMHDIGLAQQLQFVDRPGKWHEL